MKINDANERNKFFSFDIFTSIYIRIRNTVHVY